MLHRSFFARGRGRKGAVLICGGDGSSSGGWRAGTCGGCDELAGLSSLGRVQRRCLGRTAEAFVRELYEFTFRLWRRWVEIGRQPASPCG
jgi:hypothetical protein